MSIIRENTQRIVIEKVRAVYIRGGVGLVSCALCNVEGQNPLGKEIFPKVIYMMWGKQGRPIGLLLNAKNVGGAVE